MISAIPVFNAARARRSVDEIVSRLRETSAPGKNQTSVGLNATHRSLRARVLDLEGRWPREARQKRARHNAPSTASYGRISRIGAAETAPSPLSSTRGQGEAHGEPPGRLKHRLLGVVHWPSTRTRRSQRRPSQITTLGGAVTASQKDVRDSDHLIPPATQRFLNRVRKFDSCRGHFPCGFPAGRPPTAFPQSATST